MKLAVIGSRNLMHVVLENYLPQGVTEIVSGGARGVDCQARAYALENGIKLTEFLPEYERYGRGAPLRRNKRIVDYADEVLALWDGVSRGTAHVIAYCRQTNKKVTVCLPPTVTEPDV